MYEKLQSASPNWYNLGLALKVCYADLANIEENCYGGNDVRLRQVLVCRLRSRIPLTWGGIRTALRHSTVARNDVALEIHSQSEWLYPTGQILDR